MENRLAARKKEVLLKVSNDTKKLIRHSHPQLKRKLRDALRMIIDDPLCGKALKEELFGLRSLSVGRIRIIYSIGEDAGIEVITIGPRKTIYEETFKLISKEQ